MKKWISIFKGIRPHEMKYVSGIKRITSTEKLARIICRYSWAPGIFKETPDGRHRSINNLKSIYHIVLDIDDGTTIEQAIKIIKTNKMAALIATTKSHQKEKINGKRVLPPCDRFRVVLPLAEKITKEQDFKATWFELKKIFPNTDPTSKDPAHFYYPCKDVVGVYKGIRFPVKRAFNELRAHKVVDKNSCSKGNLANRTYKFILNGATDGKFHDELVKALIDLKEQAYTKSEAITLLQKGVSLDAEDMRQVHDIYDLRNVKYPPRKNHENTVAKYCRKTVQERTEQVKKERALRKRAVEGAVPFLCEPFDGICKLTMGLTLIGSGTGEGKSTVVANIIYYFMKFSKKNIIVISNEESTEDLLSRVACLTLDMSWKAYRANDLEEAYINKIEKTISKLTTLVEIIPPYDSRTNTCKLEDVTGIFESIRKDSNELGLIIMDYLQNVSEAEDKNLESYKISKILGNYLKEYGAKIAIPIVVMCQLRPNSKKEIFSSRIQNDRTIANHAVLGIEIDPDFETKLTTFRIGKDRWFDSMGKEIIAQYKNGKYITPIGYKKSYGVQVWNN